MKCLLNLLIFIFIHPTHGGFTIYGAGGRSNSREVETRPFTPVRADVKREFGIKKPLIIERPPTKAPNAAPPPPAQSSRSFPSRSFNSQNQAPSSSGPSFQRSSGPSSSSLVSKVSKPSSGGGWQPSSWSSARKPSSPHHGPSFKELGKLGGGIDPARSSASRQTSSFSSQGSSSFSYTSSVSEANGWKGVSQTQPTASSFDRLDRFIPQENIRSSNTVNAPSAREPQGLPEWNGANLWDQGGTPAPTGPSWRTTRPTIPPTTQSTKIYAPTTRAPISFETQKFQFDSSSRLESARRQLLQQSQQNERMAEARNSDTFLERYSSGPQQTAGFSSNGNGERSLLNYQNSYRSDDVRSGMVSQSRGEVRIEKPPEVRTTGNPFNAEVSDQWEGETEGALFHAMGEKDRQEFKNKNPDKYVDLDGDGVLEFDPDMPDYPNYKFFTETRWESDTDGGYIGILYVPVTRDVDGWSMTLKFSMPISKLENWEYEPTVQSPSDGVTAMLHNNHWNGVRLQGTMMRMRIMVEFDRTPGMPPGMIPQPAVALLGTIWYPDGSNANYDEGISRNTVSYNEGFSNLPKPEGASSVKSYTDPVNDRKQQADSQAESIKWNNAAMFKDNYRSQLSWLDSSLFGRDPTEAPQPKTTADPYANLSSNLIKGMSEGGNNINFSGNLAGVSGVFNSRAQQTLNEINQRLKLLEESTQTEIILNSFGEVRTTRPTTTTTTVPTTKRTFTKCEKRSIAEKMRCKTPSCFRHACLENGDFSPSQCWPKMNLCWCVTIDGLKLSTTIRRMFKFDSSSCQLTYDPTGIGSSRAQSVPSSGDQLQSYDTHDSSKYSASSYGVSETSSDSQVQVTEAPTPRPTVKFERYSRHDWTSIIKLSSLFYFSQMSGKLPIDHPVRWRLSAHENDGRPCGVDLSGGFYDSGDFMKYTFPLAWTMTMLSWGAIEHRSTLESVGRWADLSKIITHGAEYLLKTNPSPREVYAIVGDPEIDHQYWGRPQDQNSVRPCLKVTQWTHGTDLAAEVASALAAASMVVSDETLASKCWFKAKEIYDYGDKHRGKYSDVVREVKDYYPSNDYTDELAWGALWLYKASKTEIDKIKYMNRAKSAYSVFQLDKRVDSFNWDQKHAGVQLLMAELNPDNAKYKADISTFCDYNMPTGGAKYTPGGLLFIEKWGVLGFRTIGGPKFQKPN